jgi:glucose-6-phosphate dehydrogenase assembly protein OpcA
VLALGRVLTLVIVTDDGSSIEGAIEAANSASREHPCRVIVLARGQRAPRRGSTPRSVSAGTPGPAR